MAYFTWLQHDDDDGDNHQAYVKPTEMNNITYVLKPLCKIGFKSPLMQFVCQYLCTAAEGGLWKHTTLGSC